MRRTPRAALLVGAAALGLAAADPAAATIYKCQGDGGIYVYQEEPCPAGRELRNFDVDPPDLSVIPAFVARTPPPAAKPKEARTLGGDATVGKATGDPKERKFIRAGMTEAEVLLRIGHPDATSGGGKDRQTRWSYLPADGDPDTVTSITFAGGVVSEVTRKVVKR